MSQIYLFTGENGYTLGQELLRWRSEFVRKHGAENCLRLDGPRLSLRELLDEVSVMPFLATKRLVVIDGLPPLQKDEWKTLRLQVHPDVAVVIVDVLGVSTGTKRSPAVTRAAREGVEETLEFPALGRPQLLSWMRQEAEASGIALGVPEQQLLVDLLGDDQALIASEVQKLALYRAGQAVTTEDIEELVLASAEGVAWRITDLIAQRKGKEALAYALRFLERGGEPWLLWNTVLSFARTLVLLRATAEEGVSDAAAAAKATGLPFPSARGAIGFASTLAPAGLVELVRWLVEADRSLKSGGLKATDEQPGELLALLELSVVRLGQLA